MRSCPAWTSLAARSGWVDLVGSAAFATLTLLFVFAAVVPQAVRSRLALTHDEAAAHARQRANAMNATARKLEGQIKQIRDRISVAPVQIRPVAALNARLSALVSLAGECGVAVADLKPGESVRGPRFVTTPVHVSGRGTYRDVARFLHRLHERLPDFALDVLKVAAEGGGQYALDLRWFALPPDASSAAVATAGQ